MITEKEYNQLRVHLPKIQDKIPFNWGRIQSKDLDRRLSKMLNYNTYAELNEVIQKNVARGFLSNNNAENNYYRYRWFIYKCSEVDEYIFNNIMNNIYQAPLISTYNLIVKGFVILPEITEKMELFYKNPLSLVDYLYKEQKKNFFRSRRLENRLFVAYHCKDISKEPAIRCDFELKESVFEDFIQMTIEKSHKLYTYLNERKSDVILIQQNDTGTISYGFGSENGVNELMVKIY